ncbi:hypothetical protein F5146DRAFT_662670 [Armillaria mellea]|nr:hypothetical protein F5146DRAFT_662670 [Armillaria mellea]
MAAKLLDHHLLDYIVKLGRLLQLDDSNNMLVTKMWMLLSSIIDQYTPFACYRFLLWRINRSTKSVEKRIGRDNVPGVPMRLRYSWNKMKAAADFYTTMGVKYEGKHGKNTQCLYTECANASEAMRHAIPTCSACEQVVYCSAGCQRRHWIDHKICI